jgi:hypothetical protein
MMGPDAKDKEQHLSSRDGDESREVVIGEDSPHYSALRPCSSEVAAKWFNGVETLEKHLVWFEHSGHMPMTEEPGKFFLSLVRLARPIAEKAGDLVP